MKLHNTKINIPCISTKSNKKISQPSNIQNKNQIKKYLNHRTSSEDQYPSTFHAFQQNQIKISDKDKDVLESMKVGIPSMLCI